jgi:flavin reductase (DIM6/NTAB) family NADH-FMN oxidoreductase RutF
VFRQLLGRFATGVSILTARDASGRLAGMTANSLASVSLHPPLVSVCVEKHADMHPVLGGATRYVLNVLRQDQEELSRRFATHPLEQRLHGIPYRETEDGLIVLEGTLAHIECQRYADFPLGDHTLFVGRVSGGKFEEGLPLLYYRGGYGSLKQS